MRNISLLLFLFLVGLTNAETLPDRPKNRVDFCLDLGFLTPHGYGANVAVSLDFKSLNSYRPFAAFGFNVITGLTYSTGIEYQINPRFKLGLLFSVAGGEELGQHHICIGMKPLKQSYRQIGPRYFYSIAILI